MITCLIPQLYAYIILNIIHNDYHTHKIYDNGFDVLDHDCLSLKSLLTPIPHSLSDNHGRVIHCCSVYHTVCPAGTGAGTGAGTWSRYMEQVPVSVDPLSVTTLTGL